MRINLLALEILGFGFKIEYRQRKVDSDDGSLKPFRINKGANEFTNPYIFAHVFKNMKTYSLGIRLLIGRD